MAIKKSKSKVEELAPIKAEHVNKKPLKIMLIVKSAFESYDIGDRITNNSLVSSILATEDKERVIKVVTK